MFSSLTALIPTFPSPNRTCPPNSFTEQNKEMLLDYIKHKIKEESLKTVKIKITMKYEALFVFYSGQL